MSIFLYNLRRKPARIRRYRANAAAAIARADYRVAVENFLRIERELKRL